MAKIVMMAMALRKDSFNKKLIRNAHRILTTLDSSHQIELLEFNDFPMSVYNGDDEVQMGVPEPVKKLGEKISSADALILSTPEYNGGIPGPFKNAIDWVSRIKPVPWTDKKLLLIGASPGALGAVRSLWHSRVPLEALFIQVFPEMFGLPLAHLAFDENGKLKDPTTEERLQKLIVKFLAHL